MTDGVNLGFVVEAVQGDALQYEADVLAVKHSPRSGGLGAQVRKYLTGDTDMLPNMGEYRIFPGGQAARAEYVLMVGAAPIFSLRYPQLRDLGRRFLEALWEAGLDIEHMLMTLHGVRTGAGLDEEEAFRSLLLGLSDAFEAGRYPPALKHITFIEKDANRVQLMANALERWLPQPDDTQPAPPPEARIRESAREAPAADTRVTTSTQAVIAGPDSFEPAFRGPTADESTPHVFVAMPFRDTYDDHYYLAVRPCIADTGLLCERMDLDAFTGDIKARMLERIRSARIVVALLDGANPNVYLEVGYAWGVETPVILIAHQDTPLPFDVQGERVLIYDKIYLLKDMLAAELRRLLD